MKNPSLLVKPNTSTKPSAMEQKCLKCEICDIKCIDRVMLIKHLTAHDRIGSKYQCDYCKINFIMNRHLKQHYYAAHLYNKSFQCKECPKMYFKRIHYERHIIIAHCTSEKFNELMRTQFREMADGKPKNKFNTRYFSRNTSSVIDLTVDNVISIKEPRIDGLSSKRTDEYTKIIEHSLLRNKVDTIDLTVDSFLKTDTELKKRSAFHNIEDLLRRDPLICSVHKLKLCVCRLINKK